MVQVQKILWRTFTLALIVNLENQVALIMKALVLSRQGRPKKAAKMRHGSATSKAAAAGRKQLMHIRSDKATKGSPQSIYRKEKAAKKAPPPPKKENNKTRNNF